MFDHSKYVSIFLETNKSHYYERMKNLRCFKYRLQTVQYGNPLSLLIKRGHIQRESVKYLYEPMSEHNV